ncbi:uncharacterized protein LOC135823898 isoform X4 [Sycon ciliatum]
MSSQEVEGFSQEVRRRGATLESLQAAVPPEQPQLSSTSRKVTWKSPSSYPRSWTHCYSMGTMLLFVICLEGQHLRDEILYTIVHYIFSVHSVEMDKQDEAYFNMTLLHYCAECGNDRLANILIGRGADVNAQSSSWRLTPLHYAVCCKRINVVKVMLSHDSNGVTLDTTLRDKDGKTALDLARQYKNEGCVQLLVDHESAKFANRKMKNPWKMSEFRRMLPTLIETLDPFGLRTRCDAYEIITPRFKRSLASIRDPNDHNERLLDELRGGDADSFHRFLSCIRESETYTRVKEILAKLEPLDIHHVSTAEACASVDSRSGGHGAPGSGHHSADGSGVQDSEFMSLGAIGGKTLDQIADWHAFVSSIEPFIGGEEEGDERANCGKAAVQLVAPEYTNYYRNVLKSFHEMKKGNIGGLGKGENNLFCILLYLMKRPSTTVQELFNLLADNAKHSRRRLFTAIKNAEYLKQ